MIVRAMTAVLPARCLQSRVMLAFLLVLAWQASPARAELKLGTTFSNNMVVQRGKPIPVWGLADPNASVQIQFGDEKGSTQADGKGHWKVMMQPLPVGGPYTAKITSGNDTINLQNILSGDVWLCAGQSNMQLGVGEDVEAKQMEAAAKHLPQVRLLPISKWGSDTPLYRIDASWEPADSSPTSAVVLPKKNSFALNRPASLPVRVGIRKT